MMSFSPLMASEIVSTAQQALDGLNREFGTGVNMKVATLQDLRDWGLNPQFAGFVIQESPATIWIVPENIRVADEAVRTVYHEFQHIRDLTGACPFCTGPMRELRALEAEKLVIAGRIPARSARINEAIEATMEVLPQKTPLDLTIPPECSEFLNFISDSLSLIVENSKLLGRLELLTTEAAKRGPAALQRVKEVISSTTLDIENERDSVFREVVRMALCMNRLERQRLEERFREIVKPVLGRPIEGRTAAINNALETAVDGALPDETRYRMKLQAVIGELVAAQSHLAYLDPDMAAKIRGLKKRLQLAIWGQMA